jgi:pimeloyl-ACP methyl ester carboxylesterase
MHRLTFLLFAASAMAVGDHRLISIGERKLSIDCDGDTARTPTVVLLAGGGRTSKDWAKVQPEVAKFARVCSYDRAGFGDSDKVSAKVQPTPEVVDDLSKLLAASGEKGPYILVTHSIAGIYARAYAARYPEQMAGFVFVDSSHEEQALRLHELNPKDGDLGELTASVGFYTKLGQKLEWHTDLPVIDLARGQKFPRDNQMSEEQFTKWDGIWRSFQADLAKRSPRGEMRIAEKSGHFIQIDQPEMVIQAIRDVMR